MGWRDVRRLSPDDLPKARIARDEAYLPYGLYLKLNAVSLRNNKGSKGSVTHPRTQHRPAKG